MTYAQRHSLSSASEGFALPDLAFCPIGRLVQVTWRQTEAAGAQVRFLRFGEDFVEIDRFRAETTRLVEAVLDRLESQGVSESYLHQEWKAISDADAEESAFCKAVAALGLDPFNMSNRKSGEIIETSQSLPESLLDDFLAVSAPRQLRAGAEKLKKSLDSMAGSPGDLTRLRALREKRRTIRSTEKPWETGYTWARSLRAELGLNGARFKVLEDLGKPLKLSNAEFESAILGPAGLGFADALVGLNQKDSPCFVIEKRQESSRLFAFCRALFDYLSAENSLPALVVDTHTEQQRRNRAFAAEFLAPSRLIQNGIRGAHVGAEEIHEIAEEFGVSDFVVAHQIENHRLAQTLDRPSVCPA
jgi:hypothetical protein